MTLFVSPCPQCGLPRPITPPGFGFGGGGHHTGPCQNCNEGAAPREESWPELSDVARERMRDGSHE